MSASSPRLLSTHEQESRVVIEHLRDWCVNRGNSIHVLEAGCGREWSLAALPCSCHLTGLDLDPAALRIRLEISKDLDAAIHGDLRNAELPSHGFDLIYCAYVLEHIEGTQTVLCNFLKWVRPGGAIVVKIPDGNCAYGLLTRMTPHWFHVLYYRWILGNKAAGKPGYPPYPTVFEDVISYSGMLRFAEQAGLSIGGAWATRVETGSGVKGWLIRAVLTLVEFLSLGRFPANHNTLTFLMFAPTNDKGR
jgi:SAM-dependent methyltransferase